MKFNRIVAVVVGLNAVLIGLFIAWYVTSKYPRVGLDYEYFVPHLIDTYLHYRINGLSIEWYTPGFGGGLPSYPNPQQIQFSVTQLLVFFVDPWSAILGSVFIYSLIGFLASYYFSKKQLEFHPAAALIGALVFSTSGYFIEHSVAGHLAHMGFTLLPCFLVFFFERRLSALARGSLLSLLSAVLVYSGGFYPAVFLALSILVCLPLIYLIKPQLFAWRQLGLTLMIGVLLIAGLTASKIWAVDSFMRFFPRISSDHFNVPIRTALTGLFLQLAGTMSLAPLYWLRGIRLALLRNLLQAYTGAYAGYWELDLSVSPIVWLLLATAALAWFVALIRQRLRLPSAKNWLAGLLLVCTVELTLEFTLARGLFYPYLSTLPILRSLHVNSRYGSAFIFPLAIVSAWIFQDLSASFSSRQRWYVYAPLNIIALVCLGAYVMIPRDQLQQRIFSVDDSVGLYQTIRDNNQNYPVKTIMAGLKGVNAFRQNASSLTSFDPLFGYNMQNFKPLVHPGSVTDFSEGVYNMTNPTGFVYPEINGTSAFERIADPAALQAFINRKQPAQWKIPVAQQLLDVLAVLTLLVDMCILGWTARRKFGR